MRHKWKARASDGWVDGTCEACGRSEGVLPLPGFGGPLRVVYKDIGTHRSCPGRHGIGPKEAAQLKAQEAEKSYWAFAVAAAVLGAVFLFTL